ncbi:MAG: hypothetical protein COV57_00235 [Candidatus Liptonbacteria bacterium CG11_big_fil_rev_8_21_14_0_20_35_14]|uniref:Uncharacterized protein n=1 Tax=Candidatus Liptonbacteria bacterium CG11_big_fil_rev_8_21_14_0_20_35_14 TaxID=1974634 RepID=A0A2H0N8J3_9BACT|nr:MAG: hypothetical protein COV57_00235 [Candidatus Liptonbacteria bacterium CG11_big_fil_rev_8_21_14_0_20_35_14]
MNFFGNPWRTKLFFAYGWFFVLFITLDRAYSVINTMVGIPNDISGIGLVLFEVFFVAVFVLGIVFFCFWTYMVLSIIRRPLPSFFMEY